MKNIDKKTVLHVGMLSRLDLSDEEVSLYSTQLAGILSYIDELEEIDTKDVLPTSHPLKSLKNVFRKDIVTESLPVKDVLTNAPSAEGDFFRIPPVIEGR